MGCMKLDALDQRANALLRAVDRFEHGVMEANGSFPIDAESTELLQRRIRRYRERHCGGMRWAVSDLCEKFDRVIDLCPDSILPEALPVKPELRRWAMRMLYALFPDETPTCNKQWLPAPGVTGGKRLDCWTNRDAVHGRRPTVLPRQEGADRTRPSGAGA